MMKTTEIYNSFSVVVVPFPFTDGNQNKRRPALVLSTPEHQKLTQHATLMMITSAKHSSWSSDYLIGDLAHTGLTAESIVRQKLFTIDLSFIIRLIGKLSMTDKKEIIKRLGKHLNIKD